MHFFLLWTSKGKSNFSKASGVGERDTVSKERGLFALYPITFVCRREKGDHGAEISVWFMMWAPASLFLRSGNGTATGSKRRGQDGNRETPHMCE